MRERTWRVPTREDLRSLAWPTALRAAAAIGIPLTTATLLGHHDFGLMTSTGAFTVLYGAGRPARNRVRLLVAVALGFVVVSALGAFTAGVGWAAVALLTAVGAVATFVCHALRVGIPGAFFFIMVAGVAGFIPSHGQAEPAQMVLATAVGAACAVPVALADLLRAPAGPQERAVAAARSAVERFVGASPGDPAAPELSHRAAAALHHAWQVLWAGGDSVSVRPSARSRVAELRSVHRAYTTHLLPGTSPDPDLEADLAEVPLGVPSPWHMLRRDLRSPTVALSAAGRVAVGVLVAGLIALTMSTDHMYWAMMVAALVLHQGLDRRRSLIRARHRLVGTVVGLGLFAFVSWLDLGPWATVLLVVLLQGTVELAIPRNYAVAVTFITPLALTIATAGSTGTVWPVVAERLLDTTVGVAVAVGVLLAVGRRSAAPMLRSYVARVLSSCADALDHVGAGTVARPEGRAARRELSLDMQDLAAVSARALADDPGRAEPWMTPREETAWLGLTVLAHCAAATGPADGVGGATWAARSLGAAALRGTPPDPGVLRTLRAVLHRPSDQT
ncbi:fusaric acid resistance family protein [Georgenia soli]|uniref:Fusaric acid resistance family protein n=1 Tax=Georgenia soli TaxID=638953 RepID=A0A2A9ESH3_9MICO|nr:FUSC family protein [Georgenia soli]PFG41220.1 fusaric acid resistance family protein [Georgenia soli]